MSKTESPEWYNFEDEVCAAAERAISARAFPFYAEGVKVRRKAEYPVPGKNRVIKMEVSFELFRKGAKEPFQIWLWECKHKGSRRVEVGDVEILHSKILQLGASRTSGAIVSTKGFQKAAKELAITEGIGLYMLKKELESVLKYGKEEIEEQQEMIFTEDAIDMAGKEWGRYRFDDLIRGALRAAFSKDEGGE